MEGIITGACGVGKSTLAKEWAKLKNGAMIERADAAEQCSMFNILYISGPLKKLAGLMNNTPLHTHKKYPMEVIIITGACGVVKSTLAKEWVKLKNGAMIERADAADAPALFTFIFQISIFVLRAISFQVLFKQG